MGRVSAPARRAARQRQGAAADAYHDFAQSATLLDLLGERYQAALSHLALGRLVAGAGARSVAERHLGKAAAVFTQLGAERDIHDTDDARALLNSGGTGENVISPADADDAIVRRIVDAAALPDLLARETALALMEVAAADAAVLYVQGAGDDIRIVAAAGCDEDAARALVRGYLQDLPAVPDPADGPWSANPWVGWLTDPCRPSSARHAHSGIP